MKTTKHLLRRSDLNVGEARRPQVKQVVLVRLPGAAFKPTASASRRGYYKSPLKVAGSRFAISTPTTESYSQSYFPIQPIISSKPPVAVPETGAAPTVHQRSALISQHPAMMRQSAALRRNLLNSLTPSE